MIINRPKFKEIGIGKAIEGDYPASEHWVVEPKMDGMWGAMHIKDGKYQIWSRTGKLKAEGEVDKTSVEVCILGEFMFGSNWAKRHDKVGKFYAFDLVQWDGDFDFCNKKFEIRRLLLQSIVTGEGGLEYPHGTIPDFVEMNKQWPSSRLKGVWEEYVQIDGYEGLVLKRNDESYMESTWLKIKNQTDIDYVCMGFGMGHKGTKYEDTVGSIYGGLYDTDGELKDVCHVGGLTEFQRAFFNKHQDYFKGKVFKAHGYDIFPSGAIRHGKFKNFRTDKERHECYFTQCPSNMDYRDPIDIEA